MYEDASGISFQLAMYRWEDDMRQARALRQRRSDENTTDVVLAQYNDLVIRFNKLADAAAKAGTAADASQVRLEKYRSELAEKDRELRDLKRLLEDTSYSLQRSLESRTREADYYKDRALKAEGELRNLRSQSD